MCLVFGLENVVDFLSSVVVFWRFYCPGNMSKEVEEHLHKREKRASIAISFILTLLGLGVITTAIDDIKKGPETNEELKIVYVLAFCCIFLFSFLTIIKFKYSAKLESASLYKDGICSLIGTITSIAMFVNTAIVDTIPKLWYLDPLVAFLAGVFAFFYGIYTLGVAFFVQGLPIFSIKWWMLSQGDGMDEMGGRELRASDYGPTSKSTSIDSSEDSIAVGESEHDLELTSNNKKKGGETSLSEVV